MLYDSLGNLETGMNPYSAMTVQCLHMIAPYREVCFEVKQLQAFFFFFMRQNQRSTNVIPQFDVKYFSSVCVCVCDIEGIYYAKNVIQSSQLEPSSLLVG